MVHHLIPLNEALCGKWSKKWFDASHLMAFIPRSKHVSVPNIIEMFQKLHGQTSDVQTHRRANKKVVSFWLNAEIQN